MQILICSATEMEIAPLLHSHKVLTGDHTLNHSILGVGIMSATYNLLERLQVSKPDLLVLAGIAGSFDPKLGPGSVVEVSSDLVADLGVLENNSWLDLFDMKFLRKDEFPFTDARLLNPNIWVNHNLLRVHGITVNQVSSSSPGIEQWRQKYNATIESMEGAAVHYVCLRKQIPFIHLRAVSNFVGERDKTKWNIPLAVENLNRNIIEFVDQL